MRPTPVSHSERHAHELLRITTTHAERWFSTPGISVFALGSMAHGGFAPEVSDIDIALVFEELPPDSAERIGTFAEYVREHAPAAVRPLADRLSIFWSDWCHLRKGEGAGRFPAVDRADLMEHGVLLAGRDLRHTCPRLAADVVVQESAHFATRKFSSEAYLRLLRSPGQLLAAGAREATRAVLVPVRVCRTLAAGDVVGNDVAAAWYAARRLPGHPLATVALSWRRDGLSPDDQEARQLLLRHLPSIHAHLAERLRETARPSADLDMEAVYLQLTGLSQSYP